MLQVKPIDRKTIDAWPIRRSGVPARVVNSVARIGLQTVGQLRRASKHDLMRLRGFGHGSAKDIRHFFAFCQALEKGSKHFATLEDLLAFFLSDIQYEVLCRRFGLKTGPGGGRATTLQAIGDQYGLTRERARQIQAKAIQTLQTCAAQACLAPLYDTLETYERNSGRTASAAVIPRLFDEEFLDDHNPYGILHLLRACAPGAGAPSRLPETSAHEDYRPLHSA